MKRMTRMTPTTTTGPAAAPPSRIIEPRARLESVLPPADKYLFYFFSRRFLHVYSVIVDMGNRFLREGN
jgi:hypothetical protein